MTTESDELLFMVRQYVAQRIPSEQQAVVVDGIIRTLVIMMSDPRFYGHLSVVQNLAAENEMLRQHLAMTTAALARYQPVKVPARRTPPRKKTAKKTAPKRNPVATNPTVKVKGSTAANRRAFKQGYRGR